MYVDSDITHTTIIQSFSGFQVYYWKKLINVFKVCKMAQYAAEVTDKNNPSDVQRVIVASPDWAEANLGGQWVRTIDPYVEDGDVVTYTGPGQHYDPGVPEQFVSAEWDPVTSTTEDPEAGWRHVKQGELVWHNGRAWRNQLPDGSPNTWEPGVANWREYPLDGGVPVWIQPTGAFDAYPEGFIVKHNGDEWQSNTPSNTWEPGAQGITQWDNLTNPPVEGEWAAGVSYNVDDVVTYNAVDYTCIQAHTSQVGWEPDVTASLWTAV